MVSEVIGNEAYLEPAETVLILVLVGYGLWAAQQPSGMQANLES